MNQTLAAIAIVIIFLAGIVPLIMGIVHYVRDNRRLDSRRREKSRETRAAVRIFTFLVALFVFPP